jgi:hypothetical protein
MSLNAYIRNEWQSIDVQVPSNQPHVWVSDVKCFAKYQGSTVFVTLALTLRLDPTDNQADFARVSLRVGLLDSLDKVRLSTIMTSVDETSETRFSQAMLEFQSEHLVCTAFPFLPHRSYEVNAQFFYRVS